MKYDPLDLEAIDEIFNNSASYHPSSISIGTYSILKNFDITELETEELPKVDASATAKLSSIWTKEMKRIGGKKKVDERTQPAIWSVIKQMNEWY